jgi:hypothetical protein
MLFYTTPTPRALFQLMPELKDAELKVLMLIIYKTLGFRDMKNQTRTGRKETDWIAGSQFRTGTGLTQRAIGGAIESLFSKGHIIVMDDRGGVLDTPAKRKGKTRMYYRLSPSLMPASEEYSQYIRRKVSATANTFRITSY